MRASSLAAAVVTLAILFAGGCGDGNSASEPAAVEADSFSEFFVEGDGGFIFERVDRAAPEPLQAAEGDTCFTDPAWAFNGAPYDRGASRTDVPTETQRGEVNVMGQCGLANPP